MSLLYEPINLVTIPVVRGEDSAVGFSTVKGCLDAKKCYPTELAMLVLVPRWIQCRKR